MKKTLGQNKNIKRKMIIKIKENMLKNINQFIKIAIEKKVEKTSIKKLK